MNPNDPQDWLIKADRDLALIQDILHKAASYPDLICYHCQQAAEKYLKASLLYHGQPIKRTHDLEELLDLIFPFEKSINADFYNKALVIKNYAVHIRYPNPFADPSEADVLEAVECARFFRNFAVRVLSI